MHKGYLSTGNNRNIPKSRIDFIFTNPVYAIEIKSSEVKREPSIKCTPDWALESENQYSRFKTWSRILSNKLAK